jgi:hypothetical protein
MSGQFVSLKYTINADCSVQVSFSVKANELPGVTMEPYSLLMVPVIMQEGREFHMTTAGAACLPYPVWRRVSQLDARVRGTRRHGRRHGSQSHGLASPPARERSRRDSHATDEIGKV